MEKMNDDLDEVFDDSSVFAHFENNSFRDPGANTSKANNLNVSILSCDEEIKGYDKLAGKTWIYPTNYPIRDYQFNIINAALTKNTLVSLPTGLGKTFIAAVVMFNIYSWYPTGKIIFMAPTRPLVAQQIEACYNIIAMPRKDTIEMTGHMQVATRKTHWTTKRVIFATPQVIYNDIKSGICPGDAIRCLVFDEAHRAKGNYAYCQIISTLTEMGHRVYRVLALSATPGSKVEDVISVVKNLHISHLELRNENCIDVVSYSHSRKINTVIVQLGPELTYLRQKYVEILDGYARRLKQYNILPQNVGNLTKGRIVMLYKEFQGKERGARHPQHNYIMKDFTLLIALYHGLELLVKHGTRVFLNFFDDHPEKSWIQSDDKLTAFLERLRDDLGVDPLKLDTSVLPDGTIPEVPKDIAFGHPKFYKLKEIMLEHFNNAKQKGQVTKAIVFCEYRESVNLVHCLLLQCRPLIVPQMFVGQGASGKDGKAVTSQKQQLRVMRGFRSGACNALVCTCVAEEGLDVGAVDLILCFDVSTRSPVRLVQRCGRTGRERGGQVFILVTEGKEHQILMDCMRQRDVLNQNILQSKEVQNNLYKLNPRMIPLDFKPECQKMFITIEKDDKEVTEKSKKKGQKDLRTMFEKASSVSSKESKTDWITEDEFYEIYPGGYQDSNFFSEPVAYFSKSKGSIDGSNKTDRFPLNLSKFLELQKTLQKTVRVGHSVDTEILTAVLNCDTKRFESTSQKLVLYSQETPSQNVFLSPSKAKPTKRKDKNPVTKSPNKYGDIRTLFSTATKSTKNYTKHINDLGIDASKISTRLLNLLVDLSLENANVVKTCYICLNICSCEIIKQMNDNESSATLTYTQTTAGAPFLPDIDLIDELNKDSLIKYAAELSKNKDDIKKEDINADETKKADDENDLNPVNVHNNNFDMEIDFESLCELDSLILEKETEEIEINKEATDFDIGDASDIFRLSAEASDSSPEKVSKAEDNNDDSKSVDALDYFHLSSIDDIFADSDGKVPESESENEAQSLNTANIVDSIVIESDEDVFENETKKDKVIIYPTSPSILSSRVRKSTSGSTSPILCSQKHKPKTKEQHFESFTPKINATECTDLRNTAENKVLSSENKNVYQTIYDKKDRQSLNDKSMFTITQLVDMINKSESDKTQLSVTDKGNDSKNESKNQRKSESILVRSPSPVILTQRDRKSKMSANESDKQKVTRPTPTVVLDSDSDDSTFEYDIENVIDNEFKTEFQDETKLSINITENKNKSINESVFTKQPELTSKLKDTKIHCTQLDTVNKIKTIEPDNNNQSIALSLPNKRKFVEDSSASPYFSKKPKLNEGPKKALSLQKKVLAALSNEFKDESSSNNNQQVNFMVSSIRLSPILMSQKENFDETLNKSPKSGNEATQHSNLDKLQKYRRDNKSTPTNNILKDFTNTSLLKRKKISFSDSDDDDFVTNKKSQTKKLTEAINVHDNNHHKSIKKKKASKFLDLEAEISDDACNDSGDELTDESVGSIVDFICDENVTDDGDMQALYLKSVKSPVKGVFKIPQLMDKYRKSDIFSQYVTENDSYEMDSFCVDSHIGLTQTNEVSELELAEMLLEEKRRKKSSKNKPKSDQNETNNESPIIKRKFKNTNRRISSDSEDST